MQYVQKIHDYPVCRASESFAHTAKANQPVCNARKAIQCDLVCRYGPCDNADLKDRMKRAVALLGPDEVKDIMSKEGKIEVTCEFCQETYSFEQQEVLAAV